MSDEQLESLVDIGATVHPGTEPPTIAGTYDLADGTVEYAENEESLELDPCTSIWTVESTDEPHVYTTSLENYGNCSGGSEGTASYISGSDDCFTLYSAGEGDRDGCEISSVAVISGCLTEDGISDFRNASILVEHDGSSACQALIDSAEMPDENGKSLIVREFVERQ